MRSQRVLTTPQVAGYCRVSTREQVEEGWSIETQEKTIKEECDRRFGESSYVLTFFKDEGESGTKGLYTPGAKKGTYRPAFSEMVKRIRESEFDYLIVSQLNRIARASKIWHDFVDEFIAKGELEFISIKESFDTSSAAGRLHASILIGVAEYQASEGAERVKLALGQRAKDGFPLGYRPYGWTNTPADLENRTRPGSRVVPEEAKWVQWMVDKYLSGWSFPRIADELNKLGVPAPKGKTWHLGVVKGIIFNPFHYGIIEHNDELIKGFHYSDRLFDPEVLDRLREVKASRKKFLGVTCTCSEAPLAGLIRCGCCGNRLYVVHPRSKYRGYRCLGNLAGRPKCERRPHVRGEFVEPRVFAEIEKITTSPEVQEAAFAEARRLLEVSFGHDAGETEALQHQIDELDRKQKKLVDLYMLEEMPKDVVAGQSKKLGAERSCLEARLAELKRAEPSIADFDAKLIQVKSVLSDFPRLWDGMNNDEKKATLDTLIESLTADQRDGLVHISLKLAMLPSVSFDIPVVSSWTKNGDRRRPTISLRALGMLENLTSGLSIEDIEVKLGISRASVRKSCRILLDMLGVENVEEAVEAGRPLLEQWGPYVRSGVRFGGSLAASSPRPLTEVEIGILKLVAAGHYDKDITAETGISATTLAGIRGRIRDKLRVRSGEAAVARAVKAGIIRPDEPSPALLLRVYQDIVDGKHAILVKRKLIKIPSPMQMDLLIDITEGIEAQTTSENRKISLTAVCMARKRMWAVVGGTDLRSALEHVTELQMLPKSLEESEHEKAKH
jgi:site-specific DNA recombinase